MPTKSSFKYLKEYGFFSRIALGFGADRMFLSGKWEKPCLQCTATSSRSIRDLREFSLLDLPAVSLHQDLPMELHFRACVSHLPSLQQPIRSLSRTVGSPVTLHLAHGYIAKMLF